MASLLMESSLILLLFISCIGQTISIENENLIDCKNDSQIFEALLVGYNKDKVPSDGVEIEVEVWVQEISAITEVTSEFQLDVFLSEKWLDPKLNYADMNPCNHNLILSHQLLKSLWTPQTTFVNSKTASIHESPNPNTFLMLYPNGSVWINYRFKLTGPCDLQLQQFPFDTVSCNLMYESYRYNAELVQLKWSETGAVPMKDNMGIAEYQLSNVKTSKKVEIYPAGVWNTLQMSFEFKRRCGWYILQAYLPTYLIIFVNFTACFLGTKGISTRTTIGLCALLAMIFHCGIITTNLQRFGFIKAMDVWMLGSLTFVVSSLLQLILIGIASTAEKLDKIGSVTLPTLFLLFNAIYWGYYV